MPKRRTVKPANNGKPQSSRKTAVGLEELDSMHERLRGLASEAKQQLDQMRGREDPAVIADGYLMMERGLNQVQNFLNNMDRALREKARPKKSG